MATRWVRDWSPISPTAIAFALGGLMLATWAGCGLVEYHQRAQALSRATGKSVSLWDTLWMDLTVASKPSRK